MVFEASDLTGSSTSVYSYRIHYNFVTTANSAVDAQVTTTVSSYNGTTCSTNTQKCATQPTHTGSLPSGETFSSESSLDTLAYHAMWRAAYRNFGSFENVVFDHTVQTGSNNTAGERWYEFRGINTSTGTGQHWVDMQDARVQVDVCHRPQQYPRIGLPAKYSAQRCRNLTG